MEELPHDAVAVVLLADDNGVASAVLVGVAGRLRRLHVKVLDLRGAEVSRQVRAVGCGSKK